MKLLATILMGLALIGCAGTKSAYKEATDPYEKAYVILQHYSLMLEQAALMVQNKNVSEAQANALRIVRDQATPVMLQLRPLAEAWKAAQTPENTQALERSLASANAALARFINAMKED